MMNKNKGRCLEQGICAEDGEVIVLREEWPHGGLGYGVKAGAGRLGAPEVANAVQGLVKELRVLEEMEPAPILGVLGSMNGGKSSFVASLLSADGARRVARGTMNAEATNRFVFWLPAKWDDRYGDGLLWRSIESQLNEVFGSQLEFLPNDAAEAHRVTSGADQMSFSIPLVAFDERLDNLNCCLLDAPDVESRMGEQGSDDRLRTVEQALGVCHAAVYVVQTDGVRSDQIAKLGTFLQEQLKSRPIFLAINKVRQKEGSLAERVGSKDVQNLVHALSVSKVFGAYDFDARSNEGLLPEDAARKVGLDPGFPWFFEILDSDDENAPSSIGTDRFLVEQFRQIAASALWEKGIDDKIKEVRLGLETAEEKLGAACKRHKNDLKTRTKELFGFVTEQMTEVGAKGGRLLKIPFSASVMQELSESFLRTAPLYARPALWMNRGTADLAKWMRKFKEGARNFMRPDRAAATAAVDAAKESLEKQKGESFLRAKDFTERAFARGINFSGASKDEVTGAWERVVEQMVGSADGFGKKEPEREALDKETHAIWKSLPLKSKLTLGVAGIAVSIAGLMAALLAFVDFGVSAVILTSSTAKLFTIIGVGGAATIGGGIGSLAAAAKLDALLRKQIAVPAYCRTVAAVCDVFGLPRLMTSPLGIDFEGTAKSQIELTQEDFPGVPTELPVTQSILANGDSKGWNKLSSMLDEDSK